MVGTASTQCTAFEGSRLIAQGRLEDVAPKVKEVLEGEPKGQVLIFEDATSQTVEIDLRGSLDEIREMLAEEDATPRGPGRPKLGVVAREVTLLPQHWDWLNAQPGGASVALRKLVHEAKKANADKDRARVAKDVTCRFMTAVAGDLPGFEEATRALYAGDLAAFESRMLGWPEDVRVHAMELAGSIA